MALPRIDLTAYIQDATIENPVIGELTGYISRKHYSDYVNAGPVSEGHFISVTKIMSEFYQSDDLQPRIPKKLGLHPDSLWPAPYILFYKITCGDNLRPYSSVHVPVVDDYPSDLSW